MSRIIVVIVATLTAGLITGSALAKLPPPAPVDPAKAEEAKQKAADAAKAGALLQAKYEDKAAANYATKAKAAGKPFNPQMGPGLPPPPPAPVVAAAPSAAPAVETKAAIKAATPAASAAPAAAAAKK